MIKFEKSNKIAKEPLMPTLHFKDEFDIQLFQDMIDRYGGDGENKIFVINHITLNKFTDNIDGISSIFGYELVIDNIIPNDKVLFCERVWYKDNKRRK